LDAVVEAWIDRAYGHLERGEVTLAVPAVQEALQLAEPERMRRPFMDSTSQLRRLLRANADAERVGQLAAPFLVEGGQPAPGVGRRRPIDEGAVAWSCRH
jgi:hypothetical protein